jgi:hypothetical protein
MPNRMRMFVEYEVGYRPKGKPMKSFSCPVLFYINKEL